MNEEDIREIRIIMDRISSHLIKCPECDINFTMRDTMCPLCEARIKGDKKILAEWKEILK